MLALVAVVVALGGPLALQRMERALVYPFDDTRVRPGDLGLALKEAIFVSGHETLVLWVGAARPGKPVILYFHGNAGNLAARTGRFKRFAERGYGLVALGYRGSSGSTGRPSERNLGYDAARLWRRIGDFAGDSPVVMYGESLGGGVALAAIAETGRQPAGLVLEAPFTSVQAVARAAYPQLESQIARMQNRWNSLDRIAALRAPLLVLHGTRDAVIPIGMGRRLFAAAPSQQKQFHAVPGGQHTDLWRSDTLPVLWRFIERPGG
ncbi:alpha/beta hydrolase [Marimonas arenosa]|uniref:Lysophospholipase n=1 Tax=Marimonas arenosa TaxID=1795305 RepID=A0AAE3W9E1_9RHOB|nr:alpha/beta fold hydrolase [Marimonas arenosa]MDQ2088313.1 lysophospholipase [Marimonas arenosa]